MSAAGLAAIALDEVGRGERGGNNAGPDIWRYRRGDERRGSWCAVFALYCLEEALAPGMPAATWLMPRPADPFDRFDRRGRRIASAKLLTRRVGEAGAVVGNGDVPRAGDLVCWHRPRNGIITWRGHVGIVTGYDVRSDTLFSTEGNRGRFPATVKEFDYRNGAWRQQLFRVARPTFLVNHSIC